MKEDTTGGLRLNHAARTLADEFNLQLSGSRQVTRLQIVETLARVYALDTSTAQELFEQLCEHHLLVSESIIAADASTSRSGWRVNLEAEKDGDVGPEIALSHVKAPESAAVDLLKRAIAVRATDIHLEPYGDELETRFRIDGRMEHFCRLSHDVGAAIGNQFKLMANMEVDERHDVTFVSGLRTLLRLDPDIVLLGEIRDPDTAAVAMRAASSGKFVFSSFHTRDVASTVTGLRDLQVDSRSMAGNIRGIISQRLVRRLCTECREYRDVTDVERQIFLQHGVAPPKATAEPTGCTACRGRGCHGRIGVFEVEANNADLMQAIEQGAPEDEVRRLLSEGGGVTLIEDALAKVRDGITSFREAQTMTWVTFSARAAKGELSDGEGSTGRA